MELEFLAETTEAGDAYLVPQVQASDTPAILNWEPMVRAVLDELGTVPTAVTARKFHNALANAIVAVARSTGLERVLLSGGCFQNRYLTDACLQRLIDAGFRPYWHQRVPPNDGGIALGQVIAAATATRSAAAENHLATT